MSVDRCQRFRRNRHRRQRQNWRAVVDALRDITTESSAPPATHDCEYVRPSRPLASDFKSSNRERRTLMLDAESAPNPLPRVPIIGKSVSFPCFLTRRISAGNERNPSATQSCRRLSIIDQGSWSNSFGTLFLPNQICAPSRSKTMTKKAARSVSAGQSKSCIPAFVVAGILLTVRTSALGNREINATRRLFARRMNSRMAPTATTGTVTPVTSKTITVAGRSPGP